jgi:hypothetical protein
VVSPLIAFLSFAHCHPQSWAMMSAPHQDTAMAAPIEIMKEETAKIDLAKLDDELVGALDSAISLVELLFRHSGSVADRVAQQKEERSIGESQTTLETLRMEQLASHGTEFLLRVGRVQSGIAENITSLDNFVPLEYTAYRERLDADLEEEKLRHVLEGLAGVASNNAPKDDNVKSNAL